MSTLKLSLFGLPTPVSDGRPLYLPPRKSRAHLVFLALCQGNHSHEELERAKESGMEALSVKAGALRLKSLAETGIKGESRCQSF